jgi:hypothetical protein
LEFGVLVVWQTHRHRLDGYEAIDQWVTRLVHDTSSPARNFFD